jgi:hypothetical protein
MGARAKLNVCGKTLGDSGSRFGHGLRKSLGVLRSLFPEIEGRLPRGVVGSDVGA